MIDIEYIKKSVSDLIGNNKNGHDDKHVFRVYSLAMKFCDKIPNANRDLVAVSSLLHDCDDYKLFGEKSAKLLTNTNRILNTSKIDAEFGNKCLDIIHTIGYSKRLQGIIPNCIEGKIVSDADMADATGSIGIIRCLEYHAHRSGNTEPFFDSEYLPIELNAIKYKQQNYNPAINHFFDKILRLRDMALTAPGRQYLETKHQFIVSFLENYFQEVNVPNTWSSLLAQYK